jgi:hypothetical protein
VEYGYLYSEDRSRKDEINERTPNKESSTWTAWPRGNREMPRFIARSDCASSITGPLRRSGRSQCRRPRNKGRPTRLRWTLSGEKQPVNACTYVEGSSLRGKPITNLETRRELDAGHGKPRPYKFVAPGTFVATVVSGGGGCVSWVGCVWCGGCRPLSKPASDDGPALVRVIEMALSKRRRRS